jgi:hypothetical protein
MFLLRYRRCHLPPKAILAQHCLAHREWNYGHDCAKFLNLSLLEAVSKISITLKVYCSKHTLMPRSKNFYITPILILSMLAAVYQSNSPVIVCTDTDYAVGRLYRGISISSGVHRLFSTGQDGVIHYVRIVPIILTSSNRIACV